MEDGVWASINLDWLLSYIFLHFEGLSGEKCLSVSIGNLSCLVECHCISNQDFLEVNGWIV
jgi:hypothetical protein